MQNKLSPNFKYIIIIFSVLLSITDTIFAENLSELYKLALNNDPTIQSSYYNKKSSLESLPQAVANFLPDLSATATTTGNSSTKPTLGDYNNHSYTLSLSQPIFNFDYLSQYAQAKEKVKAATSEYISEQQDLIVRLTDSYLSILSAINNLTLSQAEYESFSKLLEQTKQKFEVGLIAATDVHEAQARLDNATADVIIKKNLVTNSYESLSTIIGKEIKNINLLKSNIKLSPPNPNTIEDWVKYSLENNLSIKTAKFNLEIAKKQINKEKTGHMPSLELTGEIKRSNAIPTSTVDRSTTDKKLGLTLTIPIFSGGSINSKTKEALYNYKSSQYELDKIIRDTISNTKQTYRSVLATISEIKALKKAVESNTEALKATTSSFELGSRNIVDVLNAQRNLLNAERNYADARYAYILDSLKLKQLAGNLSEEDIFYVNSLLKE